MQARETNAGDGIKVVFMAKLTIKFPKKDVYIQASVVLTKGSQLTSGFKEQVTSGYKVNSPTVLKNDGRRIQSTQLLC